MQWALKDLTSLGTRSLGQLNSSALDPPKFLNWGIWTRSRAVVPHFKEKGNQLCSCVPSTEGSHWSATLGRSIPRCWRGQSTCQWNLIFKGSNAVFVLIMEHWTGSTPSWGCWRGHESLPKQSICALWTWKRLTTLSFEVSCWGCSRNMG